MLPLGFPKLVWFGALNMSARNCSRVRSWILKFFAADAMGEGWYYRVERLSGRGILVKYKAVLVRLDDSGYVIEELPYSMHAATPKASVEGLNEQLIREGVLAGPRQHTDIYPIGA